MSREEKVISKLQGTYDYLEFINDNYRYVLDAWKNKNAGADETPADDTTAITSPRNQLRHDYRDK